MKRQRRLANSYAFYSQATDPIPVYRGNTGPLYLGTLPHETWSQRVMRHIGNFFAAVIKKINQLLALALTVLMLLLFTRFLLLFFGSTHSLFAGWVFWLSSPLMTPFNNLAPALPYNGFSIDISTLVAIIVYALAVALVRQFLKVLVARP